LYNNELLPVFLALASILRVISFVFSISQKRKSAISHISDGGIITWLWAKCRRSDLRMFRISRGTV